MTPRHQRSLPSLEQPVERDGDTGRPRKHRRRPARRPRSLRVSESILNGMFGAQLLANTADGNDHIERLTRSLALLLPAIVADASLDYFREFLARESLRQATASTD